MAKDIDSAEPGTGEIARPRITALICALNEAINLPYVLPRIPAFVDEVLLVDGHSTDNTVAVARELRPDIHILYQPGEGKDDALRCGFEHASGDIIVTLDADGTTNPEEMPRFIEPLLNGYDFAKGTRFFGDSPRKMPIHRRFGNWLIVFAANTLHRTDYTDLCCGYNAFWRNVLDAADLRSIGFGYEPEIVLKVRRAGLRIVEVQCFDVGRIGGESKLPNLRQGWGAIKTVVKERLRG